MGTIYSRQDDQFRVRAWSEVARGKLRFRVRYWYRSGEKCSDAAGSEAEAIAKAEGIWQAHLDGFLTAPDVEPETIGELAQKFIGRDGLAHDTVLHYEQVLGRFADIVGPDRPLAHVGKGAVGKWMDSMTCNQRSLATYFTAVRAMFKWAVRQGFLAKNPTDPIPAPKYRVKIRPWLQHHEWQPFLDACGPPHRIRAEFTLHTGLRAAELMGATWDWMHGVVGRKAISVPASKSARARAIPLDRRASEVLVEAREFWPHGEYIFANRKTGRRHLWEATVKACQRSGVTRIDFHGLRRSAGARWLELGASILEVSRLLGHSSVTTTAAHYAGMSDATLAGVMDRVDRAADLSATVPHLSHNDSSRL